MSIVQQCSTQMIKQKIEFLKKTLQKNKIKQLHIQNIKSSVKCKITALQQKMRNEKIYLQKPFMKNVIGYINLVKKVPIELKAQLQLKRNNHKQSETINQLTSGSNKKSNKKILKAILTRISSTTNPKQIDFIMLYELEPQKYRNGLQRYKKWKKQHQTKQKKQISFTTNDKNLLFEKYKIYRDNWDKICNFFDGWTFQELYYRFQYDANKQFKKGRWTRVENMKLIVLVEHFGEKKWAAISKKIKQRSQIQVRQRFCNILDPKVCKIIWTPQQTQTLLKTAKQQRFQWSKVVKHQLFQNKTDNVVWRKFRSIMLQKSQKQIIQFININEKDSRIQELKKILIDTKRTKEGLPKLEQLES